MALATAQAKRAKKPTPLTKIKNRPSLDLSKNYGPTEGAIVAGVSASTFWRAIYLNQEKPGQGLPHYRVGRRIVVSGEQIKAWLEKGGQTGRSIADVEREKVQAEARRTAAGAT